MFWRCCPNYIIFVTNITSRKINISTFKLAQIKIRGKKSVYPIF